MKIKKNLLWGLIISSIIFIFFLVIGIVNLTIAEPLFWSLPIISISLGSTLMIGIPLTIYFYNKSKEDSEVKEATI